MCGVQTAFSKRSSGWPMSANVTMWRVRSDSRMCRLSTSLYSKASVAALIHLQNSSVSKQLVLSSAGRSERRQMDVTARKPPVVPRNGPPEVASVDARERHAGRARITVSTVPGR
jgi:hypothetical protein